MLDEPGDALVPDVALPGLVDGDTEPGEVLGVPRPEPLGVVVPLVESTPEAPELVLVVPGVPGVAVVSSIPAPELPGVE